MTFWDRLQTVRRDNDVLEHPFYVRWTAGELSPDELAAYSGQYRHVVVALAHASRTAATGADPELREHLEDHAAEEAAHVALWDRFVEATGGDAGAEPTPETAACAEAWAGEGRDAVATLAALYAIEAAQPLISEVKRRGLVEHYGFEEGPATDYFDVHATLDLEHAEQHRRRLEERVENADQDELIDAARSVLRANWKLLDGVERIAA